MWAGEVTSTVPPTNSTTAQPGQLSQTDGMTLRRSSRAALAVAWSREEPHRVGQVILLPGGPNPRTVVLGRGPASAPGQLRAELLRQRPGGNTETVPLGGSAISREQLEVVAVKGGVFVRSVGRCPMVVGGLQVSEATLLPGETLSLQGQLHLVVVRRPGRIPALRAWPRSLEHPFGEADAFGFVGESAAMWEMRDQLAFIAGRQPHVLVLGASGTGKELAANAIHGLSDRGRRTLVARNAATLPEALVDAELFGNVKDYPNPGMPERAGLVGMADQSTLFLDEIAELPEALQSHLLRVLDSGGDYQRLGEARNRRADLRLVAATNRSVGEIKHDLLARLKMRIELPGLSDRREDIPLIARHLVRRIAEEDPEVALRFTEPSPHGDGLEPRFTQRFIERLLIHRWTHHVRELDSVIWASMGSSTSTRLDLTPAANAELNRQASTAPVHQSGELSIEEVRVALERAGGIKEKAWKQLGLKNRWVLNRLMKKYELD